MTCSCPDWEPNVRQLDAVIALDALRTGCSGYLGKPFIYCPWCGEKLMEMEP